jgi:hypothetical protein
LENAGVKLNADNLWLLSKLQTAHDEQPPILWGSRLVEIAAYFKLSTGKLQEVSDRKVVN